MIFASLKSSIRERFTEALSHLNHITALESHDSPYESSLEVKIFRGFFYVHLYAVIERTVTDLALTTISDIQTHSPQNCHLLHSLNVLSQSRSWQSLHDSSHRDLSTKAARILNKIDSDEILGIDGLPLIKNLDNIWTKTIVELLDILGISDFHISPSDRALIDEIVEKRNAVAHGRESPVVIGERHRSDVLRTKFTSLQEFCLRLVAHIESYCHEFKYLRISCRDSYSHR